MAQCLRVIVKKESIQIEVCILDVEFTNTCRKSHLAQERKSLKKTKRRIAQELREEATARRKELVKAALEAKETRKKEAAAVKQRPKKMSRQRKTEFVVSLKPGNAQEQSQAVEPTQTSIPPVPQLKEDDDLVHDLADDPTSTPPKKNTNSTASRKRATLIRSIRNRASMQTNPPSTLPALTTRALVNKSEATRTPSKPLLYTTTARPIIPSTAVSQVRPANLLEQLQQTQRHGELALSNVTCQTHASALQPKKNKVNKTITSDIATKNKGYSHADCVEEEITLPIRDSVERIKLPLKASPLALLKKTLQQSIAKGRGCKALKSQETPTSALQARLHLQSQMQVRLKNKQRQSPYAQESSKESRRFSNRQEFVASPIRPSQNKPATEPVNVRTSQRRRLSESADVYMFSKHPPETAHHAPVPPVGYPPFMKRIEVIRPTTADFVRSVNIRDTKTMKKRVPVHIVAKGEGEVEVEVGKSVNRRVEANIKLMAIGFKSTKAELVSRLVEVDAGPPSTLPAETEDGPPRGRPRGILAVSSPPATSKSQAPAFYPFNDSCENDEGRWQSSNRIRIRSHRRGSTPTHTHAFT